MAPKRMPSSGASVQFHLRHGDFSMAYSAAVDAPCAFAATKEAPVSDTREAPVSDPSPQDAPASPMREGDLKVTFPTPAEYFAKPAKIYIVWRASKVVELEGLWCCPWEWLENHLPTKALCGSGVKLEKHESVESALRMWSRKQGYSVYPRGA